MCQLSLSRLSNHLPLNSSVLPTFTVDRGRVETEPECVLITCDSDWIQRLYKNRFPYIQLLMDMHRIGLTHITMKDILPKFSHM
jgi:hypothetical protein